MLEIVKATITDIPLIHNLAYQIWPATFKDILSKQQLEYMLELMYSPTALEKNFTQPNNHYYIAQWNNNVVGFMCIQHHTQQETKTKLHRIYILPEMQGKKIGKQMIDYITILTQQVCDTHIYLNVNRFNKALDFYIHIGFEIIAKEDIDIGQGYLMEDYVLEKRVN